MFGFIWGSSWENIVWVILEVIVYQIKDVVDMMVKDINLLLIILVVDGGVLCNNFMMQF